MTALIYAAMLITTVLGAFGALFVKIGMNSFSLKRILLNYNLLFGGALQIVSLAMYVYLLKFLPLSIAYPLTSLTYVWVTVFSKTFLKEQVNMFRWGGVMLIIVGTTILASTL